MDILFMHLNCQNDQCIQRVTDHIAVLLMLLMKKNMGQRVGKSCIFEICQMFWCRHGNMGRETKLRPLFPSLPPRLPMPNEKRESRTSSFCVRELQCIALSGLKKQKWYWFVIGAMLVLSQVAYSVPVYDRQIGRKDARTQGGTKLMQFHLWTWVIKVTIRLRRKVWSRAGQITKNWS